MTQFNYQGSELDLFEKATRWKSYYTKVLRPYVGGRVLEVGAGLAGTTTFFLSKQVTHWTCLEPDVGLHRQIEHKIATGLLPNTCSAALGTLRDVSATLRFDTIIYIDVMEHIENDRDEAALAAEFLEAGGRIVILCPAHPWLFTPFDQAVGHFRRYTRQSLNALRPEILNPVRSGYLDSVGMAASLANRLLLKSSQPTESQVAVWDKLMVPVSQVVDPVLRFGKSVFTVWEKPSVGQAVCIPTSFHG